MWNWYPPVGAFIAILALLGVLVPLFRDLAKIGPREKAIWTFVMFLLVGLEFRTLYLDRADHDQKEDDARKLQLQGFKDIGDGIKSAIEKSQEQFDTTVKNSTDAQAAEGKRFGTLLKKEGDLFVHQEQLAEALNGRLIPASEPTPENVCPPAQGDSVLLFLGDVGDQNTILVTHFPHTAVAIQDVGPAITLDRASDGSIGVVMDIRSKDRRIIARLSPNGFVVNKNNFLEMRKDRSSVVVIDEYGNEVLNAHYLNRNAFVLKGILTYPDRNPVPLSLAPRVRHICLANAGSVDLMIAR